MLKIEKNDKKNETTLFYESDKDLEEFHNLMIDTVCNISEALTKEFEKTLAKEKKNLDRSINLEKEIVKVQFNDPATVVFWKDGTKTVSKCKNGDTFNKETGLAMCIVRRLCGNRNYNKVFEKFCN